MSLLKNIIPSKIKRVFKIIDLLLQLWLKMHWTPDLPLMIITDLVGKKKIHHNMLWLSIDNGNDYATVFE